MLLQVWIGTSCKLNTFLNQGFLAAHCFITSPGNVRIVTAKKSRNAIFRRFPRHIIDESCVINVELSVYSFMSESGIPPNGFLPISMNFTPYPTPLEAVDVATPVAEGVKNWLMQHTHMTRAMEKSPSFWGLPPLSVDFLSRTKLISDYLSLRPFEASLSPLACEKRSSDMGFALLLM